MHQLMPHRHFTYYTKIVVITLILLAGVVSAFYVWAHRESLFSTRSAATQQTNLLQSGWDNMTAVNQQADGLHVAYTNRDIVKQDGSPGMTSPAVNIYGTHLYADDDYTLSATIANNNGAAVLRFYSSPPLTQDEFYTMPASLEITVDTSSVTVNNWSSNQFRNPYTQKPSSSLTRLINKAPTHTVTLQRINDRLAITVDNRQIIRQRYQKNFDHEVWFGFTAKNNNDIWTLQALTLDTDTPNRVYAVDTQLLAPVERTSSSNALQTLASHKRTDFQIGAAIALAPSVSDTNYRSFVYGGNFGSITTENALKWQFIHPQPGVYDYTEADSLVNIARRSNLNIHGHTLVFGEANPAWVQQLPVTTAADKNTVKNIMIDHITNVVEHFKGRVASWDVVNEPIDEDDPTSLRPHLWYKAMGESYIATAFETAHKADPTAKLYINDYGLEADGERWDTMLALVTKLKATGVPIDGVGFQAHIYEQADTIDPAVLRRHIQQLASLGLTARISEMDVYSDDGPDVQAKQYSDVFAACFSEPTCTSWTTWGITDRYNLYLDDNERITMGQDYLWDKNSQPTAAVTAIQQYLRQ